VTRLTTSRGVSAVDFAEHIRHLRRPVAKPKTLPRPRVPAHPGADELHSAKVRRQNVIISALLVTAVLAVFGQTAHFGFVNYDDGENVYANPVVARGLTLSSVGWAFTHTQVFNWIPLTTLSHLLDCRLFGLNAGGHHLVSVGVHAATAVLLFLVLRQMTGRRWCSAFVAAVFALHPLRAESVAWVSERKDVLSAFFFMLTLRAYVWNVRRPSWPGRIAVPFFFVLGLLSKSMIVTLPAILLLLDYWPLGRWRQPRQWLPLVVEKLPLWMLAAAACAAAVAPGLIINSQQIPLLARLGTALVAYAVYLRQMIFPAGLAVGYPDGQPAWQSGLALVLLAGISAGVWAGRKTRPYLLVGWLWYLGMLLPVIGIVQISQYVAHADRYTYLPCIGLILAVTWAVAEWSTRWRHRRVLAGGLMAGVTVALMLGCHRQTAYWRDSETLWHRALACTSGNNVAHNQLGNCLAAQGRADEAIAHYRLALEIQPNDAQCRFDLGHVFGGQGRVEEAIAQYRQALVIEPDYLAARINLGTALDTQGRASEAMAQFRRVLEIKPDCVEARYNLAVDLAKQGAVEEAIAQYQKVLEYDPEDAAARNNLGAALFTQGDATAAIGQYRRALAVNPRSAEAHNDLGVALFSQGHVDEALAEYQQALALQPDYAAARSNLGRALLRQGDVDGALASFQKLSDWGPDPLAGWLRLGNEFLQAKDWAEAIACYQQAVKINSRSAEACARLGVAFFQNGQARPAADWWRQALDLNPDLADVQNNLAWLLATSPEVSLRDGPKALALAEHANQLSGGANPLILRSLAAAEAETARFTQALATARQALDLAVAQKNDALAELLKKDAQRYERFTPVREGQPGGK
jgi:tetratricopeptide (TPR) repeat protein